MTRRNLIQKVLLGGTTFLFIPGALTGCSKEEDDSDVIVKIDLNDPEYSVLKETNGSVFIKSQHIIVANRDTVGFLAADSQCTHEGCRLQYNQDLNSQIVWKCPCHNSGYHYKGTVICSPAKVALGTYEVKRSGNYLTIIRKD